MIFIPLQTNKTMDLLEMAKPALIFRADDKISKIASAMCREGSHEALVFEGKQFRGILSAAELVKRNINDPAKTKISAIRSAVKKATPFTHENAPDDIINFIVTTNYNSAPLLHSKKYYSITSLALLKTLDKNRLKGRKASDVMFFPPSVSTDDTLAVARSIFRQAHADRLAVINSSGKSEGIIDALDFLGAEIERKRAKSGEKSGEKTRLGEILASSPTLMDRPLIKVFPSTPLADVVKKMMQTKNTTAVAEDRGFRGIITPRSVLKLWEKKIAGIYISISGQQREDPFIRSVIDEQIRNEIKKLGKLLPIEGMLLHIDRYRERGKRVKYSVKGKLVTEKGLFFARDHSWDLTRAVRGVLAKTEKEILKMKGKRKLFRP
jgi:CBS domain-containing protein